MRRRATGDEAGIEISTDPEPGTVRVLKLTVAYDGTRLVGWQRQAQGESVQGLLEAALARFEGRPVVVHGAGRTDAGVHALAQVASVSVTCTQDIEVLCRALNAQLPGDIRVVSVEGASSDFHARFSARSKTYRYLLRNGPLLSPFERGYVWHVAEPLDLDRMRMAALTIQGTHDFAAFQSAGSRTTTTHRTVHRSTLLECTESAIRAMSASERGRLLVYEVEGDGFLRHMVRAIVGTLVEVGRGGRDPADVARIPNPESRIPAPGSRH